MGDCPSANFVGDDELGKDRVCVDCPREQGKATERTGNDLGGRGNGNGKSTRQRKRASRPKLLRAPSSSEAAGMEKCMWVSSAHWTNFSYHLRLDSLCTVWIAYLACTAWRLRRSGHGCARSLTVRATRRDL